MSVSESFLLKRDFFERLISLERIEDVFLSLSDSPLKDHFIHIERLYEFDRILEERYLNEIFEIRKSSPNPVLSDIFLIKYDFINLKNFLKEKLTGIPRETTPLINIKDSEWQRLWKGESTELDPIYENAIKIIKENLSEKNQIPIIIDLALDNAYLCYLTSMVSKLTVPLIKEYFENYFLTKGVEIILRAITNKCDIELITKIFLRGLMQRDFFFKLVKCPCEGWREALLNGFPSKLVDEIFAGVPKNLFTRFERVMDNYLLGKLHPVRCVPFGPERVLGYLCCFTTETYNLRLIIGGKVNRVNIGLIKERLRETYV